MKRGSEVLSIEVNTGDSEEYAADIQERKRPEARRERIRRRKSARCLSVDDASPEEKALRRATKLHRWIYFGINTGVVIHLITTIAVFIKLPPASFLLVFHGIVSPSTIILYVVAVISIVYGWMAFFRRESTGDKSDDSCWLRRYIRFNKYLLLCWISASQATVFGCWKYIFAQNLDKTISPLELVRNPQYELIVRKVIQVLPHLLVDLRESRGILPDDPPLNLMRYVGIHYILFLFLLSVIPAIVLFAAIWLQQKYYILRYWDTNN
jgi:hypothetical protein